MRVEYQGPIRFAFISLSAISPPAYSHATMYLYSRNGMSGAARGGAEHLARIHGTEEDKVCVF